MAMAAETDQPPETGTKFETTQNFTYMPVICLHGTKLKSKE
jgi:hypothetical protein